MHIYMYSDVYYELCCICMLRKKSFINKSIQSQLPQCQYASHGTSGILRQLMKNHPSSLELSFSAFTNEKGSY